MGKLYDKEYWSTLQAKREKYVLARLLVNIHDEEQDVIEQVKKRSTGVDYTKSFLVVSNKQVYRTYSILGIRQNYKMNVKYSIIDLSILVDIWFNNSNLIDKSSLLTGDILIIHGKGISYQSETKATVLIELISTRKTLGKVTWVYIEDTDLEQFNNLYPGVSGALSNYYQVAVNHIESIKEETPETDSEKA